VVSHHARQGGDPQTDFAPVVFGNAAPQRLAEMLPEDKRGAFLAPYAHRCSSISLWIISIGLSRAAEELGVQHYSTFILPAWLKTMAQYREAKRTRKDLWMEHIIGDLDRAFPGIAGAIVQREMATAETLHHYLDTPDGGVYGFAPEDSAAGPRSVTPRTAIKGLWLASAYVSGGGFTGAMPGGAAAARAAMKAAR
jgi:all-trans-retinol 13,14-reductase